MDLRQYQELEDEFRMALLVEANRFKELQTAFEQVSQKSLVSQHELSELKSKHESTTYIINELTQLVKEQKGRLTELN